MQKIAAIVSAFTLALLIILPKGALAACTVPNTLTNGQPADATQVMANFNALIACINGTVNPGTAGQVGYYSTAGSTVSGTSLSSLLDASIGSTRGSLLKRGASGWTSITPGPAGQVLTSQGAGADPVYTAPAGGMRGLFSGQMSSVIPSKSATGLSTWLNQGTATESDDANGMYFTVPSNGSTNIARGLYGPAPTPPYSRTMLLLYDELNSGNSYVIFGWYDGTNKLLTTAYNNNSNRGWFDWNTPSSLQTIHNFAIPLFEFIWLRLADDGTNYTMSYSFDGVHYQTITTGTKSAGWLGINGFSNIFVGCDCYAATAHFTVLSYQ